MLTNAQLQTLHRALLSEFNLRDFEQLVRLELGAPLELLVGQQSAATQVFELIRVAERAGWTRDLVKAAYTARPGNRQLAEIYDALGLAMNVRVQHAKEGPGQAEAETPAAVQSTDHRLELLAGGPENLQLWQRRLQEIKERVCRVEVRGAFETTGFLVGPDAVVTSYHHLHDVIEGKQPPTAVRVRFDHGAALAGGTADGFVVPLHEQWLLDSSPPSPGECEEPAASLSPSTTDELAYALLRLARPVGLDPAGSGHGHRGWIDLAGTNAAIEPDMLLMIVQYPHDGRLRLQFDDRAMTALNANGTRISYRTATEPGASGAPCFDRHWQLVAMHHATGMQGTEKIGIGIPATAIRDRLGRLGLAYVLGETPAAERDANSAVSILASPPEPPDVIDIEDPQKGRWGGLASRDGLRLTARLKKSSRTLFIFDAIVESSLDSPLEPPVLFHLHDSFIEGTVWIREIRDGHRAVLEDVAAYGVFTIGAQARNSHGEWIGLEFDLTELAGLPMHFLGR